jgi:hypothetical protein
MKQQTLTGFEKYGKTTRRAKFLADMDRIIPWPEMTAAVARVYPKISEQGGRPPIPLERMLRIYFLQLWFNLSDPAVEEELYDSAAMRSFVGIDLGVEGAPDETTICKFRHLLERHKLGKTLLRAVNEHLHRNGIKISNGTIVDATIIGAPSSTKNKDGKRDPEMHQTAKGKQWYFGMKAHVGVDSKTKLIHTILASAANVSDVDALPYLLGADGSDPCPRAAREGLHEPQVSRPRLDERSGESEEPHQIAGTCQGRTHDRGDQASVRLPEGALPRPCQEPAPIGGHRRTGQPLHSAPTVAACVGDVSLQKGKWRGSAGKLPNRRQKQCRFSPSMRNLRR